MLGDSLPYTTKGGHRMTTAPRTPEEKSERAELELRRALRRLSLEASVAGIRAALALALWDGVDVPTKVLKTINDMDNQGTADTQ